MKRIITLSLIVIFLVLSLNVFSDLAKAESFTGKLKSIGGDWFLNTGEDFYQLNLAPEEFLAEKGIVFEAKMQVELMGILGEDELIVYSIKIGEEFIAIRNEEGTALWSEEGVKPYVVNPKKCISCRLCVSQCPTGAITMVKGKAVIDEAKCIACGFCAEGNGKFKGCPTSAISQKE